MQEQYKRLLTGNDYLYTGIFKAHFESRELKKTCKKVFHSPFETIQLGISQVPPYERLFRIASQITKKTLVQSVWSQCFFILNYATRNIFLQHPGSREPITERVGQPIREPLDQPITALTSTERKKVYNKHFSQSSPSSDEDLYVFKCRVNIFSR